MNGIRGMHERALLVGGTLRVGERPGGGVEVALHVPILEAHQ
jgi:signal transduction histidine kinase